MTESGHEEQLRADLTSLRIDRGAETRAAARRRAMRRKVLLGAAAVAGMAALVAWVVTQRTARVAVAQATVVAPGEAGPLPVLSGSGYVVTGERYVSIGVRVAGRIDRYFVEEGQSVHKGDPLVQLDDRDYRAKVASMEAQREVARANLALAEAEVARSRTLHRESIASRQELDVQENKAAVAHATLRQIEADLAQARVNLEYTLLLAPTDGVVLAKLKEVGEIAVPGGFAGSGDLVRLANLNDIRAEVDVNEADLRNIRMGQPAEVTPDAYPDAHYRAEVVKLYPQVDRQKGTLKVEVRVLEPDDRLLPDMSARITFFAEPSTAGKEVPVVFVPTAALRRGARGDSFVWLVRDGQAHQVTVETAGSVGDRIRVPVGLRPGDSVVIGDPPAREGQRVEIVDRAQ